MNDQERHEDLEGRLRELCRDLYSIREYFGRVDQPASMRTLRLTASVPIQRDRSGSASKSVGILNPTTTAIYVGIGGVQAKPNNEAITVAASSLLVLPVEELDLDLGADPAALAAGDAVIYVFRFAAVQPLYFRGL